jgi:hypothetical protein
MLDEEMDHIIREAADNHHPVYNDKAWEKMEAQLNKHLPQKKDRRRLIFFLLFFLLLGAGTIFMLNKRFANDKRIATYKTNENKNAQHADTAADYIAQKPETQKSPPQVAGLTDENLNNPIPDASVTDIKTVKTVSKAQQQSKTVKNKPDFANDLTDVNDAIRTNRKQSTTIKPKPLNGQRKNKYDLANALTDADDIHKNYQEVNTNAKRRVGNKSKTKIKITEAKPFEETLIGEGLADKADKGKPVTAKTNTDTESDDDALLALAKTNDKKTAEEDKRKTIKDKANDSLKPAPQKKAEVKDKETVLKQDKKKPENKFKNNFGLTFSIGPDLSFVKLNNAGKITMTYGAGLSYTFAKRLTARAGFYVSKKVYDAAPDQYHTPGGNYPYLTSVNGSCKIYEIPLSLAYNFAQRKKHNWFANVGLSSFIMKKEDYLYNYKTPTGQTYTYDYGVSNQNKHYFSVLNLSGGYQYKFNKRIYLQAEPYLNIPLGGVGLGKIKLNSAGILFTLTVKPFAKSK